MKKIIAWQYLLAGGLIIRLLAITVIKGDISGSVNLLGTILTIVGLIECVRFILKINKSTPVKIIFIILAIALVISALAVLNSLQ